MTDTTGLDTLDAQRLELLRRKIAERGLARPAAAADEGEHRPEMSDGQRRMWFVQSVDPDGALLNICVSYRVTGDVDVARLHRAVDAVALRHPVLRTTYETDNAGDPYPVIHDDLRPAGPSTTCPVSPSRPASSGWKCWRNGSFVSRSI